MREITELFIHGIVTLVKLLRPSGIKTVMAENLVMKQQLIVVNRGRSRAPRLRGRDRFLFGLLAFFIGGSRLNKISIALKPATILKFHKALVARKYHQLYSNKGNRKAGRKGPDQALVDLVIEMKNRNPSYGYGRISMQIFECFNLDISRFAVARILRKHQNKFPTGNGPSWLSFIGSMKDSLWSVSL